MATAGEVSADLDALLDEFERHEPVDAFANTVFAVIDGESTSLPRRVGRLGGIIVSEPRGLADTEARARETGKRTAKLVGWVRHAMGHEHP